MSNSRRLRRGLKVSRAARAARFPEKPPALGTARRWLNQGVAEGLIERSVSERTGKPGRPAHVFRLTAEGKERTNSLPDSKTMLTELQCRRAQALMNKGMSEDQAIAAVTKGWRNQPGVHPEAASASEDAPDRHYGTDDGAGSLHRGTRAGCTHPDCHGQCR